MKNITKLVALTAFSTLAFSDMTICYKKNLTDIAQVDSSKLDGGLCEGIKSQKDMLNTGWKVDNVKITNDDYVFVFKKETTVLKKDEKESLKAEIVDELTMKKEIKAEIIKDLEVKKQKEIRVAKEKKAQASYSRGERIFKNKCSSCHGLKGEKKVSNARALNTLSLEDIIYSIDGYKIGSQNLGNASEMRPYALGHTTKDLEGIYNYIQKLNK